MNDCPLSRRGFMEFGIGSGAAVVAAATMVFADRRAVGALPAPQQPSVAQPPSPAAPASAPSEPSPFAYQRQAALDPKDVQAFVGVSHGNIERVREMLESQPQIVNAAWDWGAGDWETGIGAAGHVGNREIAMLLLERGARIELPAAAMLGWLEFIKNAVATQPGVQNVLGPHAIPMWSHARAGGEPAAETLEFLESVDAVRDMRLSDDQRAARIGRYRAEGDDLELLVLEGNRRLLLQPPKRRPWYLLNQGDDVFRPADDVDAKLTFELGRGEPDRAAALHIVRGSATITALRIE